MKADISTLIEDLKQDRSWQDKEPRTKILLKSPVKHVVLTLLDEGIEVSSVQANGSVTYEVIEGKLKFRFNKESVIIRKGEFLTLDEKVEYSFDSIEDSAFLLTVKNVINGHDKTVK